MSSGFMGSLCKIHNEDHTGVAFDWVRISAMGNAWWGKIFFEKAIDKWGFSNLSGEKVKEVFETLMTGYDCDGIFSPCAFTPTEHMSGTIPISSGQPIPTMSKSCKSGTRCHPGPPQPSPPTYGNKPSHQRGPGGAPLFCFAS